MEDPEKAKRQEAGDRHRRDGTEPLDAKDPYGSDKDRNTETDTG